MAETLVDEKQELESTTVQIYRTATVVKGGRRFSFGALVVVGDRHGTVGIGYGKAPGVPGAIEKAQKAARKTLVNLTLLEGTLPHEINAKFGASKVKLVPAAPGTGVIAGATVRTVLELAGVRDCLTKSFGSNNQKNLLKATFLGLQQLRSKQVTESLRGVEIGITDVERRIATPAVKAPAGDDGAKEASGAAAPADTKSTEQTAAPAADGDASS
ncbi:MAG: 30S ribosomal protein S5 [Phycisphaeraceae bacterium]|nr:30S ribosomal protein S5 [Phycisphaeraceae bacterium]